MKSDPWSRRFTRIRIPQYAQILNSAPDSIGTLAGVDDHRAVEVLRRRLEGIYIPTEFVLSLLSELIAKATAHCEERYAHGDLREVFHNSDRQYFPMCLTGLAGVGKSRFVEAIKRVFPPPQFVNISGLGDVHQESVWYVSAIDTKTLKQVLCSFLNDVHSSSVLSQKDLLDAVRRRAAAVGVSLIVVDELQFFTHGEATNNVAKLLLNMIGIGIPMLFVANYSLCHKLTKRNQEDRHRLLGSVRVMLTDFEGHQDWHKYLIECDRVCGALLDFRLIDQSAFIYELTAGIKRLIVTLLSSALLVCRRHGAKLISKAHVEEVYARSSEYKFNRQDVETLLDQAITGRSIKLDLTCPFDVTDWELNLRQIAMRTRIDQLNKHHVIQQLTSRELVKYKAIHAATAVSPNLEKSPPVQKAKRISAKTADALLNNACLVKKK